MTDEQSTPPKKEATVGQILSEFLDHQVKAAHETGHALNALIPPDFRTHGAEAGREFLTSFKVLFEGAAAVLDSELEKVRGSATHPPESDSSSTTGSTTGKSKVKVEVS